MNNDMNEFLVSGLRELYCIRHRKAPNVFINEEGFISVAACCEDFHEALYYAQDNLREQYHAAAAESRS